MTSKNVIEVKNVKKVFGNKTALNGINFGVKGGEIFGFLGPSGAGKTTTIKILTGQMVPTDGQSQLLEKDSLKFKDDFLKNIGVLSDNSGLYDRLSIYDNLALFCKIYDVPTKRIEEVLSRVNLLDEAKTKVKKLSKGMKQRVKLARVFLHKPKLLFLDEPTAGLDPANVIDIHNILLELNKEGTTIFLTTHNMNEADKLCNRVAFLNDGVISAIDSPQNFKLKYAKETIEVLLNDSKKEVVEKNEVGAEKISTWIKNGELISIHSNEPTLADIFMKLTGREL